MNNSTRFTIILAVIIFLCSVCTIIKASENIEYAENRVIVKIKENITANEISVLDTIKSSLKAKLTTKFKSISAELWEISGTSVEQSIETYSSNPLIEYIEPDYIIYADEPIPDNTGFSEINEIYGMSAEQAVGKNSSNYITTYTELDNTIHTNETIPNDPYFSKLWNMNKIDAPKAWSIHTGGEILVGVIDSGVDYTHEDLADNIWINPGEIPENKIDDDGNGFIDDVRGWDFAYNDNDPMDERWNGTHCSGIIAAAGNNSTGIAGINWSAKIVPIKIFNDDGFGSVSEAILALEYATMMGVKVTSNGWSFSSYSQALYDAIQAAGNTGALFIASSGNTNKNNDLVPCYPSSYNLVNIITVASTDYDDLKLPWSNWGASSVHLCAPGSSIYSTGTQNSYSYNNVPDYMAAPHIAGAASLIWSYVPNLTHLEVKNIIFTSVDTIHALIGKTLTGGRLNIYKALSLAETDSIPPDPVNDLTVIETGSNRITLTWTASGDDGNTGYADSYDIRYSTFQINNENFNMATKLKKMPVPSEAGTSETYKIDSLNFNTTYFFSLKVIDNHGNHSLISNLASGTTLSIPNIRVYPDSFHQTLNAEETATQTLTIANEGGDILDFSFFFGKAANFDGRNDCIEISDNSTLDITSSLSFGAWVKTNDLTTYQPIIAKGAMFAGPGQYNISAYAIGIQNSLYFYEIYTYDGLGNYEHNVLSVDVPDTNYHFVFLTFDNGLMKSYLDGTLTDSTTSTYTQINEHHYPLEIGRDAYYNYRSLYFSGDIDEVCIFNLLLNKEEIQSTMNNSLTGNEPGLVVYINFDTNDPWEDLSGNGNNGTPKGGVIIVQKTSDILKLNPDNGTVTSGSLKDIEVTFDATNMINGDYKTNIIISSNDPDEPEIKVPAYLHVMGTPDIAVSSDTINFGTSTLSTSKKQTLIISNEGTDSFVVSDISTDNDNYTVDIKNYNLNPDDSIVVTVTFLPLSEGNITGTLTITSNDPDEPTVTVILLGEGISPPDISFTPDSLYSDLLTGETETKILTIQNTGSSDLLFQISDRVSITEFNVSTFYNEGPLLPVGNSDNEELFRQEFSKKIYKINDTGNDFYNILVMENTPGIYHYNKALNNLSLPRTLVTDFETFCTEFTNGTDWDLIIFNNYGDWINASLFYGLDSYQSNGGRIIYSDWCTYQGWPPTGPFSLFQNMGVSYVKCLKTPVNFSSSDDTHLIFNNPNIVNSFLWTDDQWDRDGQIVSVINGATKLASFEGYPNNGSVVLNAEKNCIFNAFQASNFNNDADGDGKLDIIELIENQINFLLNDSSAIWLSTDLTSGITPGGSSTDIEVTFNAKNLLGGDYNTNIVISSNDHDEPEIKIPVHLHVSGASDITVFADTLDFGSVFMGASPVKILKILNEGTSLLVISEISSDNADYTLSSTNLTINPGDTKEIKVTFTPSLEGSVKGTISISCNDPDEPTLNIELLGKGLDITINPSSFSEDLFTGEIKTQILTISNNGVDDLTFNINIPHNPLAGMAASFDGVDDRIEIQDNALLDITTELSFGAWIKFNSKSIYNDTIICYYPIITKGAMSFENHQDSLFSSAYGIGIRDNGHGGLAYRYEIITKDDSDYYYFKDTGAGGVNTNQHFIFATFSYGYMRFYLDGQLEGNRSTVANINKHDHPLQIGGDIIYRNHYFYGEIDDVCIFDRVLSQEEIQYIMKNSLNGTEPGLALYLNFDGSDPWEDLSGNSNNVTPYGGVSVVQSDALKKEVIIANPNNGIVTPGSSIDIEVTFDAVILLANDYNTNIVISSNDSVESEIKVPAHVHIIDSPDIVFSPDTINFGTVITGISKTQTLTILNKGINPLTVSNISTDNENYTVDITNFTINPCDAKEVTVSFAPSSEGSITGTLTIISNDPDETTVTVVLLGEGAIPPDISVNPNTFIEELSTGETATQTLTISNKGTEDFNFNIKIQGYPGSGMVARFDAIDNCIVIPDNPSLDITTSLSFGAWVKAGNLEGYYPIVVKGSMYSEPENYHLSAFGMGIYYGTYVFDIYTTDGSGNFDRTFISFSDTVSDYYEHFLFLTFDNGLLKVYCDGTLMSTATTHYNKINTNDYSLVIGSQDILLGNAYYYGEIDEVRIFNRALSEEEIRATMNVSLTGNEPGLAAYLNFNGPDPWEDLSGNGNNGIPKGGTDLINSSAQINKWLIISPDSGAITPGLSKDIEVTFNAKKLMVGDYNNNILISSHNIYEFQISVPVSLHVTDSPDIDVSCSNINFGTAIIGTSTTQTLIISNKGNKLLEVTDISTDNDNYTIDTTNFTLTPGNMQTIIITFTPSSGENITRTLNISSNDPDEPTTNVTLFGKGLFPTVIEVSPDSLKENLEKGEINTQILTISNKGANSLIFDALIHDGSNSGSAAGFDGINDLMLINDNSKLDITNYLSLGAWVKVNDFSNEVQAIILKGSYPYYEWIPLYINSYGITTYFGRYLFQIRTTNGSGKYDFTDSVVGKPDTNYHFLFLTFDNGVLKSYIDGDLMGITTSDYNQIHTNNAPISIGSNFTPITNFSFSGEIDEVRIFNRVLSQEEIQSTMYVPLTGNEPGLVAYFNFDGSDPWKDISGNGNDGQPNGDLSTVQSGAPISKWLTGNPKKGIVLPGSSTNIELTFDTANLIVGDYNTNIVISSNDLDEPEILIPVHLDVNEAVKIILNSGWNFISWNVDTENDSANAVLEPVMDNLEVALSFEKRGLTFDPSIPSDLNTLKNMDHLHGYELLVTEETEFSIAGTLVDVQTPILLEENWNFVSYLPEQSDSTVHAINSVIDKTIVVLGYDNEGLTFNSSLPPELNTLNIMKPNFGYWIKTADPDTLVYPTEVVASQSSKKLAKSARTEFTAQNVTPTKEWISLWGQDITLDGELLPVGTIIKAVDKDGVICGECTVHHQGMFGLMSIYKDDPRTEADEGPNAGEEVTIYFNDFKVPKTVTWTSFGDVINFDQILTALGSELLTIPTAYALYQNYPNPFNPNTTIQYDLPKNTKVTIKIFNILGKEIAIIIDDYLKAGFHKINWQGKNSNGEHVPSGIYFYTITTDNFKQTKKLILLR